MRFKTYVSQEHAHRFCYVLEDILVEGLRLIPGWTASPGKWIVLGSAIEYVHSHIVIDDIGLLPEGIKMKARVKITESWEAGILIQFLENADLRRPKVALYEIRFSPWYTSMTLS